MRRGAILLFLSTLVLASCAKKSDLPATEVIHRASVAVPSLLSARFDISADMNYTRQGSDMGGTIQAKGVLQEGGKRLELAVDVDGSVSDQTTTYTLQGALDVVVASLTETYLRFRSFSIDPPHPLLSVAGTTSFMNTWVRLPSEEDSGVPPDITPDPSMLKAQADVVDVTKDLGIQSIRGRDAYRYEVTMNKDALSAYMKKNAETSDEEWNEADAQKFVNSFAATGELWIDKETFFLHRIDWSLAPVANSVKASESVSGTVRVDITDHNMAPEITIPQDVRNFPAALPSLSSSSSR